MSDLAAMQPVVVQLPASELEAWVYAVYQQAGCSILERSIGSIDSETSLAALMSCAKEFEDDDIRLVKIEISLKNPGVYGS